MSLRPQVGLFVHRGTNLLEPLSHQNGVHVCTVFRGGADDRLALSLVAQACVNPRVTATVLRIVRTDPSTAGRLKQVLTGSTTDAEMAEVKLHAAALAENQQTVGRSVRFSLRLRFFSKDVADLIPNV